MIEPKTKSVLTSGVAAGAIALTLIAGGMIGSQLSFAQEHQPFNLSSIESLMAGVPIAEIGDSTPPEPTAPPEEVNAVPDPAPPAKDPRSQQGAAADSQGTTAPGGAAQKTEAPVAEASPVEEENGNGKGNGDAGQVKLDRPRTEDITALVKQAAELAGSGEHSAALEKYRELVKRASAGSDQKLLASSLAGAARMLHELGHYSEALAYVARSVQINQTLKNAQARSLGHVLAGRILMAQENYPQALKSFEEALKILPSSEAAQLPGILEDAANCHLRLYQYAESVSVYNRILGIQTKSGDELEAARINVVIGEIQVSRSDYKSARSHFKKAEKSYRDLKRSKELGETLFRTAYLDQVLGDVKSSQSAIQEAQPLLSSQPEAEITALPLLVKGMAAYDEGKIIQAVTSLTAALNQYERSGDRIMAARARLLLAQVELERARQQSALEQSGKALTEFRSLASVGGEARALHLISDVYHRQGFVNKALEYAQESLGLAKRINDKSQAVQSRILLADIHMGFGDAEAASKNLKDALEDSKTEASRRTRAALRLAVARFRLSRESGDRALQDALEARKEFTELNDRRGIADCDHVMGVVHELRGEPEKALSLLQQALSEHNAMWDRFGEGRDLTALGVHYKNVGDPEKALEYFTKALDLRKGIGDRRGYAANLANIGNLLRHKNQISDAVQRLEQALALYREISDRRGEADVLTSLANVEAANGSQAAALDKYSAALKLHKETYDHRGVATDLAGMGRIYLARGDLQNASQSLEEAEKANKKIRNPQGEVGILSDLAMVNRAKRNPRQALALLDQALGLAKQMNDARSVSSIHLRMASILEDSGDYQRAISLLGEALESMKRLGDRKGELWALGGMGILQAKMEDYENALANLHEAVRLSSELGVPPQQTRDLDFHLAEIYEGFRDLERALEHYHKALSSSQAASSDPTLGKIYDRIGDIYYRMEDYAKARDFLEDALRVHSEQRNNSMQKAELIRLGDIVSKLGDQETALKHQQRALALAKETGDVRAEARILTRIGTLDQMLGRPRSALEHYQEAMEKRSKLGDTRGVNENLLQMALLNSILGDFDSPMNHLKKAFEISQCSEDRGMLWKAYYVMGRTLEGKKSLGEAMESYRKAITILEAMEADIIEESDEDDFIFGGKAALFETTLRVMMNLAKKDPAGAYDSQALRIAEKLKAAEFENTLSRINVENFSDLPSELLIKEKSLKLSLRKLNSRLAEELSKGNQDQAQIQKLLEERRSREKAFRELKDRLVKEYPAYADLRFPRPFSLHQLQKDIVDPDEAIIEYMVTRSRTYIFAIDKQRFHTYSIDYSGKDLERDVELLTRPLYRADTQASWDPSVAYRLYSQVIKPIEYFLIAKKAVVVIPHGPLAALPFEILVNSQAHASRRFWSATDRPSYLLEKYAFCYSPSISVLSQVRTRKREGKPGWTLVAFGDAVYQDAEKTREVNPGADRLLGALTQNSRDSRNNRELRPLPGARKEVSEIVRILGGPTQTYLGGKATETLFKKADLSRYGYIHLATHGVLLGGLGKAQQQPAILFSLYGDQENDGFLQLGEVFGLKLNADMVVLSSCLSPGKPGSGETNGLFGLSRAFLFAGADSVILSMWQVNDDSTAKLFIEMYRNLKDGSKAEALRQAKLAMLSNQATSHPYYWAPFVLMGNWTVKFHPAFEKPDQTHLRVRGTSAWRKLLNM
ncbi:MAG: tetratricopeptide repeat protein [Desulfomonile tiedjei]|uniref:Tetratricopeptide repeat protein n=1 Tax=Desulfomonile tiedjei TaxID=2358 RepID=A0A9D6Z3G9_9BACT|nr:tetratricopeptide repeat protein [Desulfomonile tiedjei]